MELASN